jgi:general secretion pathway protein A
LSLPTSISVDDTPMYESVFGFVQSPFTLAPDPRFFYLSESHDEATRLLLQSIRRKEGFIVLTGDIGTGKTTLSRALLERLDARTFTSLVLDPFQTADELLREVLVDFGVAGRTSQLANATRHDLINTFNEFLLSLVPLQGNCVLIIDEAQHLSTDVLEQIRVLSNLETNSEKLLQIVLVGQPNLLDTLAAADMRQLNQRVSLKVGLRPLTAEEVNAYISHRLLVAGGTAGVAFAPRASEAVHALSGGVPRVINLLCDRALMVAAERGVEIVTPEIVKDAAVRLGLARGASRSALRRGLLAAAVVIAIAAVGLSLAPLSSLVDAPLPPLPRPAALRTAMPIQPVAPPPDDAPAVTPRRPVLPPAPAPASPPA